MLLFIKSVNLTLNEETGTIIISGIEHNIYADVNRLGTDFSKIQEDLEIMEKQFDQKFDQLIRLYFQDFEQEEARKEQGEIGKPVALSAVPEHEHPFLSEILPKIFFNDFLMFYDEYSYAINERINNLYRSTFINVVQEAENVRNFNEIIQCRLENNKDYKKFEYLDFYYFRNKLEMKLSKVFGNTVFELRNILYGFNFDNEVTQMSYIELFYNIVRYYKKYELIPSTIGPFLLIDNIPQPIINYENIILNTIRKHTKYISYNLPLLYNYHQEVSKIFDVSHTRFYICEKLFDLYGSIKNVPQSIDSEEKESFEQHDNQRYLRTTEYNFLYEEFTFSAPRGLLFTYVIYDLKESIYNGYGSQFVKIKDILVSIYTRV